jgi:hypothetical protein
MTEAPKTPSDKRRIHNADKGGEISPDDCAGGVGSLGYSGRKGSGDKRDERFGKGDCREGSGTISIIRITKIAPRFQV